MKLGIAATMILAMSSGCGLANSQYVRRGDQEGAVVSTTIGSPVVTFESGLKNDVYGTVMTRFEKQFIYSGKSGSTIRFSYREFAGSGTANMYGPLSEAGSYARPAFTQDVSYDLAESDTIAFQALRLKIMEATNQKITVQVLSGFAPPTPDEAPWTKPAAQAQPVKER